jgi:AcrR family transcriptional regulator
MAQRQAYHHGDLPATLQRQVLELIDEGGLEAVTMAEVARRAAVTAAAPYRHYDGLNDLLAATGITCYAEFTERLDAAVASVPATEPLEQICAMIRAYFTYALSNPGASKLLFDGRLVRSSPEFATLIGGDYLRIAEATARAVDRPVQECRTLALNISALVLGHMKLHVDGVSPVSSPSEAPELAVAAVRDLIKHAMKR